MTLLPTRPNTISDVYVNRSRLYRNLMATIPSNSCDDSIYLPFSTQSHIFTSRQLNHRPCYSRPPCPFAQHLSERRFLQPMAMPPGCTRQTPFRTFSSTPRLATRICLWCRVHSLDVISSADLSSTTWSSASRTPHVFVASMGDGTREQVVVTGNLKVSVPVAGSINGTLGNQRLLIDLHRINELLHWRVPQAEA